MIKVDENKENNKSIGTQKWLFYVSIFVAAIVIYKVLDNFTEIGEWVKNFLKIVSPFIGGAIIAYILYMPCNKIENLISKNKKPKSFVKKHARVLSVAITYIIAICIIAIIALCICPKIIQSLKELIANIPGYINTVKDTATNYAINNPEQSGMINSAINAINKIPIESVLDFNKITGYIKSAISAVNGIFDMFISFVVSVYILTQRKKLIRFYDKFNHALLSERKYKKVRKYFFNGNDIFFKFLTSQVIDAIIVGALTSVAMLCLKVKYAVLLGFIIGLFNLIPFFGAIVAVIIAIIITLLTGGIGQTILMSVVVIVLQQIDANIINPKIVGSSLDISQLLVIFAVTVGGAYFGILGMFLAVPIATVIKMVIEDYTYEKECSKKQQNITE